MNRMPQHVAVIMDGNGRWAQNHGHERYYGHQAGVEAVRGIIECAAELGIRYLTLYTFSTEYWNRPKEEVELLMGLLVKAMHNELEKLIANNVRLLMAGRMQDLPESSREAMQYAIDKTAANDGLTVVLAISYSGRSELAHAAASIARKAVEGVLDPEEISEETISRHLYLSEVPDPDILIRTGGECRLSNFLLWQLAYAEFFFMPVMWPDFSKDDFKEIIADFQNRERRYGKTGEQVRKH